MISDGIYEQIVNSKLQAELGQLDLTQYDIELEKLDADDARKVLAIYISCVIQRAFRYIREGFTGGKEKEALVAQIRLCNDVISDIAKHTGDDDFKALEILEKGEVLTSLYKKINTARGITNTKAVRPETSLLESTLFTGSKQEPNMLSEIKKEIVSSDSIDLLVSFIKWSAIRRIIDDLRAFTSRPGVKLRVIATTYMKATDYKAIEELAKLPNTEVKINYETNHMRMHAKSYLFRRNTGFSTAYIGSSNLSNPALTEGLEWNLKITEQESLDIIRKFVVTFESYWNNDSFETFELDNQECQEKLRAELSKAIDFEQSRIHLQCAIKPYPYQKEILDNLTAERELHGNYKNLIVASTGVGKTVVAAFDYRRFRETHKNARLLFIAHRKEILEQSIQKFREVLNDFNFGDLYVDGARPRQIEHLFMSIQSFNAANFSELTSSNFYDFIIVDEFHHAAANSYQKLLHYYQPKILLGLTATPERLDGKNVLEFFDDRVASEMRLVEAIDRKLLSPFQYFGVSDTVDYSKLSWRGKYDVAELENCYSADTKRAAMILKSVYQYVTDMDEVKGIGFCVSINHAQYMAEYFNEHGVPSIALSSKSVDDIRSDAKTDLVLGKLRFIFVVDLYNEGVDIPEINTILFLRPTESTTVFLQQLGRGLRLCEGKECLTVLDFIGQAHHKYNFEHKFRAMVGTTHHSIRKYVEEGFSNLPKGSYIQLEKLAQEYVFRNLKQCVVNKNSLIEKVRYFEQDTSLPLRLDYFLDYHGINLLDFYTASGSRSLHRLKMWTQLIGEKRDVTDDVYRKLNGLLHVNSKPLLTYWIDYVENGTEPRTEVEKLMLNMLYYTFYSEAPVKAGFSSIAAGIAELTKLNFLKEEILQILKYNLKKINFVALSNDYNYTCPLEIYCSYNTRQILAAFGYYNEEQAPEFREGVKYFEDKKTDIFLINLHKSEKEFSPSTMYDDYAINETLFHWETQSQVTQSGTTVQRYVTHISTGHLISLFVREYKKTGAYTSPFVFLGNARYVSHEGNKPVSFVWKLDHEIPAQMLEKANKSIAL